MNFLSRFAPSRLAPVVAATLLFGAPLTQAQSLSTLMFFNATSPGGGIALGSDGKLYGFGNTSQAVYNVGADAGLIYRVATDASTVETVYQYGQAYDASNRKIYEGATPVGEPLLASNGSFYGMTAYREVVSAGGYAAGSGGATLFRYGAGGYTRLRELAVSTGITADGHPKNTEGVVDTRAPNAGLIQGLDGFLYGVTNRGGPNGTGVVFKISTDGATFQVVHSFAATDKDANGASIANSDGAPQFINADGLYPQARLLQASNGDLYGVTLAGGANGTGVIFALAPDGANFRVLHHFDVSPPTITDTADPNYGKPKTNATGAYPSSGLVEANGLLYGTAYTMGPSGLGVVFSVTPDGLGAINVVRAFTGSDSTSATIGAYPSGQLLLASDGNLVGVTNAGGASSAGTLYKLSLDGATHSVLVEFGATDLIKQFGPVSSNQGVTPGFGVIQAPDGSYYGITTSGGPYNQGTVFKYGAAVTQQPQGTPVQYDGGGAIDAWLLFAMLSMLATLAMRRYLRPANQP